MTKRTDQKRAFNERAYDRLSITIPKGNRKLVASYAESNGDTINSLTNKALLQIMNLSEWPNKSTTKNTEA